MELCLATGARHPNDLRLTADELIDWMVYYDHQPWGETRADLRQESFLLNLAAPLMREGYTPPSLRYPYETDNGPEIDSEATIDAVAALRTRFYGQDSSQPKHPNRGHNGHPTP